MPIAWTEDTRNAPVFACAILSPEASTPDRHGACLAAATSEHNVAAAPDL